MFMLFQRRCYSTSFYISLGLYILMKCVLGVLISDPSFMLIKAVILTYLISIEMQLVRLKCNEYNTVKPQRMKFTKQTTSSSTPGIKLKTLSNNRPCNFKARFAIEVLSLMNDLISLFETYAHIVWSLIRLFFIACCWFTR